VATLPLLLQALTTHLLEARVWCPLLHLNRLQRRSPVAAGLLCFPLGLVLAFSDAMLVVVSFQVQASPNRPELQRSSAKYVELVSGRMAIRRGCLETPIWRYHWYSASFAWFVCFCSL
jgi:hypothetical protein